MPFCAFDDNYPTMGVTPVENWFIQTYLPQAPGDYVRVYLYGLMQCYYAAQDMSLEKMAAALGLSADAVRAAYTYWEKRGLVERMQDKPPAYRYLHPVAAMLNGEDRLDEQIYRYQELNAKLQQLIPDRPFSASDSDIVCQWVEDLGMPEEVVLIFVRHCIDGYLNRSRGHRPDGLKNFRLKNYDKEAMQWVEEGIVTVEKAQERTERDRDYYRLAEKVMKQLSISFRSPTREELKLAKKWLQEYQLDEAAVLTACKETVKSRNPNFAYLDAILERNRAAGSADAMRKQLAERQTLSDGVKQLYQALGIAQVSPVPDDLDKYQSYLLAGFSPESMLLIARELSAYGQYNMERFHTAVNQFAAHNQYSDQDIRDYLERRRALRAQVSEYMEKCGLERKPMNADIAQLEDWLEHAPFELVLYAADLAKGTQLPQKYMDKLLKDWAADEVRTVAAAKKLRADRTPTAEKPAVQTVRDYAQRKYDNTQMNYLFDDDEEEAK